MVLQGSGAIDKILYMKGIMILTLRLHIPVPYLFSSTISASCSTCSDTLEGSDAAKAAGEHFEHKDKVRVI